MPKEAELQEPQTGGEGTYGEIVTSSALIGSSSILSIAIGMVRTKVMALLLGPAGFGLFGICWSTASLAECLAGMGTNSSGVRQIAHAAGSEDKEQIMRTSIVLRRLSVVLGVLGAALLAIFSRQVASFTFGSDRFAGSVALLSFAVLFQIVSNAQVALIQGMRQIGDLAKMGVFGALWGTAIGIPLVYFFRERGVAPSIVAVSLMSLCASWWYSRKIQVGTLSLTSAQVRDEASDLLRLGFAFMISYLMSVGTSYLVRIIVLRRFGLGAAGLYQSAWTLGGLYAGFVLEAMGADFYPRLTASARDDARSNRLINDQTHAGLLVAGPGVIATLTMAPVVIALFYSSKFNPAVGILRWISLGAIFQVATWPMGYLILAQGRQALYFSAESAKGVISIGLAWEGVRLFGLSGAGIAFAAANALYGVLLFAIAHQLSHFLPSAVNVRTALYLLVLIALVFAGFYLLPFVFATCLGALIAILSLVYSTRVLISLLPVDTLPPPVRWMLVRLKLNTRGLT